jgi:excisionase family DNA binding protein
MDASIQKVDLGEILTAEELADRLRLSPSTVYRMARRGKLPRLRGLGRALRFAWPEVCRALQEASE